MIELINVHKAFGSNHVLRGVTLRIEKGESMVVIGGSGSGKSVLLKHIPLQKMNSMKYAENLVCFFRCRRSSIP